MTITHLRRASDQIRTLASKEINTEQTLRNTAFIKKSSDQSAVDP